MPAGGGLDGVLHPEVEDAGADHDPPGGPQQEVERGEDVAPDVGDPQRAVAQLLQLGRAFADLILVTEPEPLVPDPDGRKFHAGHLIRPTSLPGAEALRIRQASRRQADCRT